jgi:hypothetical protein
MAQGHIGPFVHPFFIKLAGISCASVGQSESSPALRLFPPFLIDGNVIVGESLSYMVSMVFLIPLVLVAGFTPGFIQFSSDGVLLQKRTEPGFR